jgi:hypothetical protein
MSDFPEAYLRQIYALVRWGTDYQDVPFEEAMLRPRYQHLRERTLTGAAALDVWGHLQAGTDATVPSAGQSEKFLRKIESDVRDQ